MFSAVVLLAITAGVSVCSANAVVPSNFNGYGDSVSGFQDFFTESASTFDANYTEIANSGSVATGSTGNFALDTTDQVLDITGGSGNPNKLLYSGASYSNTGQSVLAEIAVTNDAGAGNQGDGWRGGVATVSNASTGAGINQVFRTDGNQGSGAHTDFLNDNIAWNNTPVGQGLTYGSSPLTYYWLKLTTTTDSGGNEITGEIWPADGITPESAAQTATWNQSGGSIRSGLAGLVADSGGSGTFQVNYLLIEADGLPSITAGVPEPVSLGFLGVVASSLLLRRARRIE